MSQQHPNSPSSNQLIVPGTRADRSLHVVSLSAPTSRSSSPISPEMIEQREKLLRKAIQAIQSDHVLSPADKAREIQLLMASNWKGPKSPSGSQQELSNIFPSSDVFVTKERMLESKLENPSQPNMESNRSFKRRYHNSEKGIFGCSHYQRGCQAKAACCGIWVSCRFCHDEEADHHMDRYRTKEMICMYCQTSQPCAQSCASCFKLVGKYYCDICKFWDDDQRKDIFHCSDCRICRVGKREDYYHCKKCNVCIAVGMQGNHRCIERNLESDCPICGEFMFTSIYPVIFMPCGHGIHQKCHHEHIKSSYQCPICCKSLADMSNYFRRLDQIIATHRMPDEYLGWKSIIFCNDCEAKTTTDYHFLYHKCRNCESFNTKLMSTVQGTIETPIEE